MLATQQDMDVRELLLPRLREGRERSDRLFEIVKPTFLYERPIPERHRIIFYVGHLEAFDWNLFAGRWLPLKPFNPAFDKLFAFGIDPVGGGLPDDRAEDWPLYAAVRRYVEQSRGELDAALEQAVEKADARAVQLLHVAIEHRLMHLETLAYMLHQLPLSQKKAHPAPAPAQASAPEHDMVQIPAGSVTLGLPLDSGAFGWDNEFEAHVVKVPAFAIDRYPVTNRQFAGFIADRGYERQELWSAADWDWKTAGGIVRPISWRPQPGGWRYRTMFEEIPLPPEWPVYVSHAEASAFARWSGKQLPTEAQWCRAAYGTSDGLERDYPWGSDAPGPEFGNFDLANWDPVPVNAHPRGQSAFGVHDLAGNGWEWTSTVFGPYPGFHPFEFYKGYSADFFDGKHFVMKGGSARTAACMLRRSFRNWFQPHYQYVYAGFRCVSS